ncbi:protein kinase [Actinacidiphila acididurans]|uniref:Protein tyrosine kinase n=1 Tax=Actinacidiphila acididurans TaxID=2784346 RepID=A0ABS2TMZ3_9ACTN|nr:protein kinase [Actinacidiphila acididurans]MBM9504714.1 protein tyrosine kinase [Actinacidiphila acididurans]
MEEYAGRVLAGRYRLPRPPADEFELVETRAFDTYSGQEVLVRQVLLPEVVTAEVPGEEGGFDGEGDVLGESARRALEAARAAAALPDHPRLVQVFDIFVEDGSLWIASELVSGRPLAALLAERPLDAYRAAEVGSDVLTALRALHAHGWTHRNVTASTVLVTEDGRAMLGGLAAGAAQEALCGYDPLPEEVLAGGAEPSWHGPQSALEQERARQNRITVVGAITERWAPEQAHEVHENWRLSPPVGPAADLWALGSLLFRSVQGHPPYPEESATELVQLVCAEPAAFAEDCGPLRPVVESLLRPDPDERPEAEELGGWLRSLIRSAPEPDLGARTVQVPADPARLPEKRRRGELVRRKRRTAAAAAAAAAASAETGAADLGSGHRRHARGKQARPVRPPRPVKAERTPKESVRAERTQARREQLRSEQVVYRSPEAAVESPRRMGVRILIAVLVVLAALVAYALLVMPNRSGDTNGAGATRTLPAEMPGSGGHSGGDHKDATSAPPKPAPTTAKATHAPAPPPATTPAAPPVTTPPDLGPDFALHTDPAGFSVAVHTGWARTGRNSRDQVGFTGSDLRMTVVPGRDRASGDSSDPLAYQLVEPELGDFRSSAWSSASGLETLTVRGHQAAEGEYTWRDANDQTVYARNLAVQIGGRYHVVLVSGPDSERAAVQRAFDKAVETYSAS